MFWLLSRFGYFYDLQCRSDMELHDRFFQDLKTYLVSCPCSLRLLCTVYFIALYSITYQYSILYGISAVKPTTDNTFQICVSSSFLRDMKYYRGRDTLLTIYSCSSCILLQTWSKWVIRFSDFHGRASRTDVLSFTLVWKQTNLKLQWKRAMQTEIRTRFSDYHRMQKNKSPTGFLPQRRPEIRYPKTVFSQWLTINALKSTFWYTLKIVRQYCKFKET